MAHVGNQETSSEETPKFVWETPELTERKASKTPVPVKSTDSLPPRRALIAGVAVVALAAGAFGVVELTGHHPVNSVAAGTVAGTHGPSAFTSLLAGSSSSSPSPSGSATASLAAKPPHYVSPSAHAPTTRAATNAAPVTVPTTAAKAVATAPVIKATSSAPSAESGTDLALGKTESSSSHTGSDVAANVIDGNPDTYWESEVGSADFPQWVQVNLGTPMTVSKIVMCLPPIADWGTRTQTIQIYGLATGYNAFQIRPATSYTFDAATGNCVTVNISAVSTQYVQLIVSANSAVAAGQISEVEIYG